MRYAIAILLLTASPVLGQQVACGPTGPFEEELKKQYGEVPIFAGIANNGLPVMLFANPVTGTFSMTMRRPNKITCLVNAGKSGTQLEIPKQGQNL